MESGYELGNDGIYRCRAFAPFHWQAHGFGTRRANPPAQITLKQIHSAIVWNAAGLQDREQEGDALISAQLGISIGVRTADCVPILLLDAHHRAVCAVHAGWRGSAAQIVSAALEQMHSAFGTYAEDVHAAIGPCARPCCYEVGSDVFDNFTALFPEWTAQPPAPGNKRQLDLAQVNARQLNFAGVPAGQVFDSNLCTVCDSEMFFSYRREPLNPGRLVSAIERIA